MEGNPRQTAVALAETSGISMSRIRRHLHHFVFHSREARQEPLITESNTAQRKQWAARVAEISLREHLSLVLQTVMDLLLTTNPLLILKSTWDTYWPLDYRARSSVECLEVRLWTIASRPALASPFHSMGWDAKPLQRCPMGKESWTLWLKLINEFKTCTGF